jgi:hypothetical protein
MDISGANSVRFVETPTTNQPVEFRVNQRISAEILKVSGDQVSMVVQGQQVVGKLTSGDQAYLLGNQKNAQFIVKGLTDGVLQLQYIRPNVSGTTSIQNQWTILAQNLLLANDLPVNESTLTIGRALLSAGLPITPDLVENLQNALGNISSWGQADADTAAMLISNGLPLSQGSLSLALQKLPSLADSFQQLQTLLANLAETGSSATKPLAERSLSLLQSLSINWNGQPTEIMKQLAQAISILGKSMEAQLKNILDEKSQLPENLNSADGLLALAVLRRSLANEGNGQVVKEIDRFMDNLRQMQFLNASQTNDPTNSPWLLVSLLLNPGEKNNPNMVPAHLKIAYRADEEGKNIDPENNRIILSIQLEDDNYLEVDISMVQKRIGAWMTVPDEEWRQLAEEELPNLKNSLEDLGYFMQFIRCEVKTPASMVADVPINKINISV